MEDLELLLRLQDIDRQKMDMKGRQKEIPQAIRSLEAEIARRREEIKREEERTEAGKKRRGLMELELESSNETVKRYQRQLLDVKSNKEYVALQHEIEGEKDKIFKLEEEILTLMEEIDTMVKAVERSRQDLEEEQRASQKKKEDLEAELQAVAEQIAVKDDERLRVATRLKSSLLERYERIRERWGGLVVATADQGACGGCFAALPPQLINEIKKKDRIWTCEHCGRILFWKGK